MLWLCKLYPGLPFVMLHVVNVGISRLPIFPGERPMTEMLFDPLQISMALLDVLNSICPVSLQADPIALLANAIQFVPSQYSKLFDVVLYSIVPSVTPPHVPVTEPDDMETKFVPLQYR